MGLIARRHGSDLAETVVRLAFAGIVAMSGPPAAPAAEQVVTLYETAFEGFAVGDDTLVGTDGWLGDNIGEAVHGIDENILPGIGKSAFLGFNPPSDSFVRVFRPVDYDPVAEATPVIEFFALVGIQESGTGSRDVFYVTVLNSAGQALAGIRLRSTAFGVEVSRYDGAGFFVIVGGFAHGLLEPMFLTIDYAANTWSASWAGVGLFLDAPFTSRNGIARDLGSFAAEWQLANPLSPGDNWMLIDEWTIEARGPAPPVVPGLVAVARDGDGTVTLEWTAVAGLAYQVEYSDDLATWSADLPGSGITPAVDGPVTFVDASAAGAKNRWFRIVVGP